MKLTNNRYEEMCIRDRVGAAMRFRDTFGEVICDGNHSTPDALNDLFMAKGRDYTIMITDALMVKCRPVGTKVLFGGNEIELDVYKRQAKGACKEGTGRGEVSVW